ncbi:hypothetical protein PUR23_29130 [Methylorubrum populi]|uniref:hypothetical protein n=1 Tax=Methylorubrum populi TaxID=223967 RepID=UPI0031F76FF8
MSLIRGILLLALMLTGQSAYAAVTDSKITTSIVACYKAGNDTVAKMFSCSGFWVTPRALTLCFLEADRCPAIPDGLDARRQIEAALGQASGKLDTKLSIDLSNALELPSRQAITECQPVKGEEEFTACVAQKMVTSAVQPILNCAALPKESDRASCLTKGSHPEVAAMIDCVAKKGELLAALKACTDKQAWDKVEAAKSCASKPGASGGDKVGCVLDGLDPKDQELGRCLSGAGGRSATALACIAKSDPEVAKRVKDVECARLAGSDAAQLAACLGIAVGGDAKIAACAAVDRGKVLQCLGDARPELKTAAQAISCVQGGRSASSLVANCSDLVVKDPKTRAALACAAQAGSDSKQLAGCAASSVLPPEIARYAACASTSQGPASFALCAAGPMMNEEWRITAECAVQSGGNPVGFAGCTAGRLTLKEVTQCLSGRSCFGPNNTIVKYYTTTFNDLLHGPGKNNDIVVALDNLKEISGGPNSVINNPGQIFGGNNSIFHNPGQITGGPNSVINNPGQLTGGSNSVINNPGQLTGGSNSVVNNPGQLTGGSNSVVNNPGQLRGGHNSEVNKALRRLGL